MLRLQPIHFALTHSWGSYTKLWKVVRAGGDADPVSSLGQSKFYTPAATAAAETSVSSDPAAHSSDKLQRAQQETWANTPAAINRPPANLRALWVTDCCDRSWEITGRRKHLCHSMSVSVLSHAIDLKLMPHGWRRRNGDNGVIFSHSKASFTSHWFILHSKPALLRSPPKVLLLKVPWKTAGGPLRHNVKHAIKERKKTKINKWRVRP